MDVGCNADIYVANQEESTADSIHEDEVHVGDDG